MYDIYEYEDQAKMIDDFCKDVRKLDPDIVLGHNILGYDLPYMNKQSISGLNLGRNNCNIQFNSYTSKFRKDGSQKYDYYNVKCHGREIIDTMFLSIKFDISRKFPSYGLKQIERHLKLVDDSRVEWDFDKYKTRNYKSWPEGKWKEFREYCADDTDSPIKIFDKMIATFFYLNQSIPKTLQQIINEATGSQLDSFMIRSYLQDGYSQPKTSSRVEYEGAISFGIPGYYENVFSVDFHALYPSIIKQFKLYDKKKDPKGHMLKATEYFTDVRVEYKKKYEETGDEKYNGMQLAAKVLANSLYGFCGAGYLLYNSPKIAARITEIGRDLLNQICEVSTGESIFYWKKLNGK